MNLEDQTPTRSESKGTPTPLPPDALLKTVPAALRRRLILGGMVGVPTALAVMKPVKTLAKAKKVCSYSGWHSFKLNSNSSAHPKNNCTSGKKQSTWHSKAKSKLPKKKTKNGHQVNSNYSIPNYLGKTTALYQTTKFSDLFQSSVSTTIVNCLNSSTSNEGAFLAALFSAKYIGGYPYTVSKIYSLYSNPAQLGKTVTQTMVAQYLRDLDSFG
jgi:hypothetical protein